MWDNQGHILDRERGKEGGRKGGEGEREREREREGGGGGGKKLHVKLSNIHMQVLGVMYVYLP